MSVFFTASKARKAESRYLANLPLDASDRLPTFRYTAQPQHVRAGLLSRSQCPFPDGSLANCGVNMFIFGMFPFQWVWNRNWLVAQILFLLLVHTEDYISQSPLQLGWGFRLDPDQGDVGKSDAGHLQGCPPVPFHGNTRDHVLKK